MKDDDADSKRPREPEDRGVEAEDPAEEKRVKELLSVLKRSAEHEGAPNLLPGVQRKIRQRSRGKFYGDGWSIGKASTSTYVVTSLLMLVILVLVYFALMPAGLLRTP